ncbi:MAG: hypothetical protein ACKOAI_07645 [Acidimicrobiia bacterium]
MTTFRAKQVRALRIAIASGVAAALILPIGVAMAWNQLLDSRSSTSVATDLVTIPDTPAALIAAVGEGGQLSHLFVATLDASGVGGTVVLMPIGAATETAAADNDESGAIIDPQVPQRLADVYATGGLGGLANEVQGLLDVSFVAVGALGRAELVGILSPLGGVDVLLDRDVVTVAVDGTPTKLATAGEASYTIDRVVDILLARRANEKESVRFARHREVWNGIVKRVGAGLDLAPEIDTTPAGLVDSTNFMRRVLGGAVQVWQLSASPVLDKTLNPKRLDMYSLDRPEVVMVFASIAPSALSGADLPVAVLLDSPFNDPVVSRAAVATLLEAGIGVGAMREISARESSSTVIEADGDAADSLAALLDGSLGPVETKEWPAKVVGLDAAITLGADFVASVRNK